MRESLRDVDCGRRSTFSINMADVAYSIDRVARGLMQHRDHIGEIVVACGKGSKLYTAQGMNHKAVIKEWPSSTQDRQKKMDLGAYQSVGT